MNQDLMKKIVDEHQLTVEEAFRLDQAIEAQTVVPGIVAGLDDSAPSLSWRSELNQKLMAQSSLRKRQSSFKWVSGLAVAAAVVGVAFFARPVAKPADSSYEPVQSYTQNNQPKSGPSVEESILTAHREADLESGMGISFDGPSDTKPGSL